MKTHWLSEVCYAKGERKHIGSGPWYTYAKKQANREIRRNARYHINEGLDEIFFASDEDRILIDIERNEQTALMDAYPDTLRAALDFACRRVDGYDDWEGNYADWYANDKLVAFGTNFRIEVMPEHYGFVWNAFNLFF